MGRSNLARSGSSDRAPRILSLPLGIFRARSLRGLYVDWKSGGQVNYFPGFAREWWTRWIATGSGRGSVAPEGLSRLNGVDFVVLKKTIDGVVPVFQNAGYAVYATTSQKPFYGR